jgi:KDO2-lipid IV(A) lauroyltransferase
MDERNLMFVPFFAHPYCATIDVMPKLAQLADAVVIPMATYREGNHYVVEFWPAWENYPTGDMVSDVTRMNHALEEMILKHPEQYLWMHKRFKTQPNMRRGQLYADC